MKKILILSTLGFSTLLTAQTTSAPFDLLSEARAGAGGTTNQESHSPTYSGGLATPNWGSGTDFTIANVSGAGYVAHIWLAIGNYTANGLDAITLTAKVDGEEIPRINNINLDMLFARENAGQSFTLAGPVSTRYTNWNVRGQYSLYLPIPYGSSILITLHNNDTVAYSIWSQVAYVSGVSNSYWSYTRRLNIATGRSSFNTVGQLITLVDVTTGAKGRLLGIYLTPDGLNSISPPFAFLEGAIKIYTDGAGSPQFASSGTEDYFFSNGYFIGDNAPQCFTDYSCLLFKNPWAIYALRWHILDPITFNTGLKVTWNAGDASRVNFTGTGSVSWTIYYYTEN